MKRKLRNLGLTTVLIQLAVSICGATSATTALALDDSESKILVSVVPTPESQANSAASDWSIDSGQVKIRVIRSERLSSHPETLIVLDAARLQQNDLVTFRAPLIRALRAREAKGQAAKIAWVDDQGWVWISPGALPDQLPEDSNKQQDSFEAAVFLDWLREIILASKSDDTPLQVVVFTRDFPVCEFMPDSASTSYATRSLPRQCLDSVVDLLTNQPSRLQVINFSPDPGYLVTLAQTTGGSVTHKVDNDLALLSVGVEKTYVLTLLTSFRESEDTLPFFPIQPVKIQVRNQRPEWEIQAPQLLWPLPAGIQPPTLSELLEAQQLRPRADSLEKGNDLVQALVLARRIATLSPFSLPDRLRILKLLRLIGNPDPFELERSVDEALALFPGSTELCYQKGLSAEEGGRTEEAIRWYEKALKSDSAHSDLYLHLAQLYMRTGQWKRSVECFETIVGTEVDSAAVRLNYASALRALGSPEQAVAQLEVARKMNPGYLPIIELEMRFALESEEYKAALDLARRVLESHPKQPTANFAAGLALTRLQQYEAAVPYLEAADATHFRDNFDLQYGFYECLMAQGRLDEAAPHLKHAAAMQPTTPGIWMKLAMLHERRGDRLGTGEALKRGAENNTDDVEFHLSLAEWLERHGDGPEALASLEKVLALSTGQERSQVAQKYVLLTLQESGSYSGLKEVANKLDPELDKELLQMIKMRLEARVEENAGTEELKGMMLPGGFEPLLNHVPFLKNRAQGEDFLDLLFGYLLETEPLEFANQKVVQTNPRRDEAVTFYREFLGFEKWLKQEVGSREIEQPITTQESDLEAANQILSYFGVKVRRPKQGRPTYTPDPDSLPKLEVIVSPRYERRRTILKWFGISSDLIGEGSVLKFQLEDANVPVMLGFDYWNRNIFKVDPDRQNELLLRWLGNPKAMKLYRALVRLPTPARQRFINALTVDQLMEEITPGLLSMGNLLEFDNEGLIILPGGKRAIQLWSHLVQASVDDERSFLRKLFTHDDGKALYFLASLSRKDSAVLDFLLSDPVRFKRFYEFLKPPPRGPFLAGRPARSFHDMADLLTTLQTDGEEIYFPTSWKKASSSSSQKDFRFAGDEELIRSLFESEENGSTPDAARRYAMLRALTFSQSPLLCGAPERLLDLGALFGLVVDLGFDSDLVEILLQQIDSIETQVSKSDRRTVVALFQAPLVILRILANNQVLEGKEVSGLVAKLLSRESDSWIPGDVALQATLVLLEMTRLLAEKSGPGQPLELLLRAFAQRHEPMSFIWNGEARKIDLSSHDIEQMRTSLDEHYTAPLDNLLQAFYHLTRVSDDPSAVVEKIAASVGPLLIADSSSGYLSDQYRQAIEHTNAKSLQTALDDFRRALLHADPESRRSPSKNLTNELAPYLAEALISLIYVRHIKEDDFVVQTDEHFFRKHAFDEKAFTLGSHGPQEMGGSWGQPILVKDKVLGSRIVGSLAGISRPLLRLRTEQLQARSSTRFADSTFPVTQKLAVELVNSSSLTNGTLVCVGRTMDLARKVFAASVIDEKLRSFVFITISKLCGSGRSWETRQHIQKGNLGAALDLILPSEMFQLGKEYWMGHPDSYTSQSPVEADLAWFFQRNPGCTWHITNSAENPTNELGFPLSTSVGVDLLFLGHLESIEASATYNSPHRLAERSCELKLRMAELFWRMGLPSPLFKIVCDRVLDRVLPRVGQVDREDWRAVTQQLKALTENDVQEVLTELFDN